MSYTEIQEKTVTCKKPHRCAWCNEMIEPKEKARYRVYIFDSDFGSDYMHLECNEAMEKAPAEYIEDGWTPGSFKRGSIDPA